MMKLKEPKNSTRVKSVRQSVQLPAFKVNNSEPSSILTDQQLFLVAKSLPVMYQQL